MRHGSDRNRRWRTLALAVLALIIACLAAALRQPVRTLASLRKVDDHPLYVMRYYGGYLFDWYLKQGVESPIFRRLEQMNLPAGCTTFAARTPDGEVIFGRNFDWRPHAALVLFTDPPGGHASVTMVDVHYLGYRGQEQSWAQRLALLFSPYVTVDGMNEHGLAASMMEVPCRPGPRDASQTTIVSNHAMRLALDHARDVDEALDLLANYNIDFPQACTHYLFADALGNSVVVEFIGGQMTVIRHSEPWQVATNFLISEGQPEGDDSGCWRYNAVYQALSAANGTITQEEAMTIASSAAVDTTVWSVVYNLTTGDMQVVMGGNYDRIRTFALEMAASK